MEEMVIKFVLLAFMVGIGLAFDKWFLNEQFRK